MMAFLKREGNLTMKRFSFENPFISLGNNNSIQHLLSAYYRPDCVLGTFICFNPFNPRVKFSQPHFTEEEIEYEEDK